MNTSTSTSAITGLNKTITQIISGVAKTETPQLVPLVIRSAKQSLLLLSLLLVVMYGEVRGQDRFWYKADGAIQYNGTTWDDELNITNATNSGSPGTVTLGANSINFNPSLSFTNVYLQMQTGASASVRSFIIVNNPTTTVHVAGLIGTSRNDDHGIRLANGGNSWQGDGNGNDWYSGGGSRINGSTGFAFTSWHIVNQNRGSTISSQYYIGGYYDNTRAYSGNIAEVMAFSGAVPNQDRVETYLAVKYGITLGHDYLNGGGTTIYAISGYGANIAGLGNDNTYGLNQKVSASTSAASSRVVMATTNNFSLSNQDASRSALTNGQYLIWGHNNAAIATWTTSGLYTLVSRLWKAQNTGPVGSVYFQIDLSGYPAPPTGGSYKILVDNDGNFTNGGTTEYTLTNLSGTLWTTSIPFPSGTSYFTVGMCTPLTGPAAQPGSNAACSQITANWSASSGATGYYLDVATDNGFSNFVSGYNNFNVNNVTTYNVTGLTAGTTYYYRVKAYNTCGTSVNSNTITYATLARPAATVTDQTNITCFAANDGTITVSVSGGLSPYYFSTDNGTSWTPSSGPGLGSPQTIGNLIADHAYRIKVQDSNGCISK